MKGGLESTCPCPTLQHENPHSKQFSLLLLWISSRITRHVSLVDSKQMGEVQKKLKLLMLLTLSWILIPYLIHPKISCLRIQSSMNFGNSMFENSWELWTKTSLYTDKQCGANYKSMYTYICTCWSIYKTKHGTSYNLHIFASLPM